jgi:hypothetical protein
VIEIYVLDDSGSPIELFSGLPHALTTNNLEMVSAEYHALFFLFILILGLKRSQYILCL